MLHTTWISCTRHVLQLVRIQCYSMEICNSSITDQLASKVTAVNGIAAWTSWHLCHKLCLILPYKCMCHTSRWGTSPWAKKTGLLSYKRVVCLLWLSVLINPLDLIWFDLFSIFWVVNIIFIEWNMIGCKLCEYCQIQNNNTKMQCRRKTRLFQSMLNVLHD